MRKTIIGFMLISSALFAAGPAAGYTLTGDISGGVFLGGITYVYAVSMDFSSGIPAFYIGLTPLGIGVYAVMNVPEGDYILFAYQDRDYNLIPSANDYYGFYGDTLPEILTVTGNMSDLDIEIAQLPFTFITGTLSYGGTNTGLTIVQAASDPLFTDINYFTILLDSTATGEYTMFADSGQYYVRAYMDLDLSFSMSEGDPSGYYGYPDPPQLVDVTGGSAQGIDINLYDPMQVELILPPGECYLSPAYPNPFNGRVEIAFRLHQAAQVKLEIYNLQGRIVSAYSGAYSAGDNCLKVDLSSQPSGIYFVQLKAGQQSLTEKIILQK